MLPINLEIKNFFSHKDSYIDFTQFTSTLLIGNVEGNYELSNGSGKCLGKNTILTHAFTGERITVKDLYQSKRNDFYVYGLDEDLKLTPTKIIASQFSGIKPLLKITLNNGLEEIVSDTHPIFIDSLNTIQASELKIGDFVAQPRSLKPTLFKKELSAEKARILALFLAEGSLTCGNVNFTNLDHNIISLAKKDIEKEFYLNLHTSKNITHSIFSSLNKVKLRKEIFNRLKIILPNDFQSLFGKNFCRAKKYISTLNYQKLLSLNDNEITLLANKLNSRKNFKRFLNYHQMYGKKSIEKCMPPDMYMQNDEIVGVFLGTFIACDGYISNVDNQVSEISIGLGSECLIKDFQILLQQRGIYSSIRYKKVKSKKTNKSFDSWILDISTEKENLNKFYHLIGKNITVKEKQNRLNVMKKYSDTIKSNPNKDLIPSKMVLPQIKKINKKSLNFLNTNDKKIFTNCYLTNHNMSRNKLQNYIKSGLDNKILNNLAFSDLFWVKVKNIEVLPADETYDIQVDNQTSLYALNGFITHNSAILESILWCLFSKSRAASMDDIIFWGENFCKVSLTFKHNDLTYRVIRKRNRVNSMTYVEFSKKNDDDTWTDISGSTSSLTNSQIEKVIKLDFKTFINSAYFRQNDISEFAESDPSKKKDILKSIIDLSKWDTYEIKAKEKLRNIKTDAKILASKIENYDELFLKLEESKNKLKVSQFELSEMIKKRNRIDETLQNLTTKYLEIKDTLNTDAWDQSTKIIKDLQEKQKNLVFKINKTKNIVKEHQRNLAEKESTFVDFENKGLKLKTDEEIDQKSLNLNNELIDIKAKLNSTKQALKELNDRKISKDNCYVCHQSIEEELYQGLITQHQEEVKKHEQSHIYCQNKISELSTKQKEFDEIKHNNKVKETLAAKSKNLIVEISLLKERLSEIQKEQELSEVEFNKNNAEIKINERVLQSIQNNDFQSLHQQKNSLRDNLVVVSQEIEKTNHRVGILTERHFNLKSQFEGMEQVKKEHSQKLLEILVLGRAVKFLGKNGIQVILLNAVIDDLEKTSNEILKSICNEEFMIFLDTQRIGSDGVSIVDTLDLRVKKEGIVQNFKSLSGGEQFRVSLALRIALSEISSRHGGSLLEFLLLDEVNSPLDRHGIESLFINVIRALEKKYKIMVITHNDYLKEKFNHIIDITKINGESFVNCISV